MAAITHGWVRVGCAVFAVALTGVVAASAQPLHSPVSVTAPPQTSEPFRFFGGRIVTMPLMIHPAAQDGLAIRAELVQLTSDLSARVAGGIEVSLSAAVQSGPGTGLALDLPVTLPSVNRETDFELRFLSLQAADRAGRPAGSIRLRAYPADLLDPVRAWARAHPVRVEDDHGLVTEFFRQQQIAVTTGREVPSVTVYVGARALRKQSRLPLAEGEAAVIFSERETETPHLVIDRTGRGTIVSVEMRLVDRLATDPLAQKTLREIFHHLALRNDEEPPTLGARR